MNYTRSAATALRLLTSFGQSMTLRSVTLGAYDPAAGSVSKSVSETTRKGVILDYGESPFQGALVQQGDKQVFLDSNGVDPKPRDELLVLFDKTPINFTEAAGTFTARHGTFTDCGVIYQVVHVKTLEPGQIKILHELNVRSG